MVPELLHLAHYFSFSLSLGKPNYSLRGLLLCKPGPLYFVGGYYLFFLWSLIICCSFLLCEQAAIPMVLSVFPGRKRQLAGLVVSAWLLGS